MNLTIEKGTRFFQPREAELLAEKMNEDDEDGWTYKAVKLPAGPYSKIEVYDEENILVGNI